MRVSCLAEIVHKSYYSSRAIAGGMLVLYNSYMMNGAITDLLGRASDDQLLGRSLHIVAGKLFVCTQYHTL